MSCRNSIALRGRNFSANVNAIDRQVEEKILGTASMQLHCAASWSRSDVKSIGELASDSRQQVSPIASRYTCPSSARGRIKKTCLSTARHELSELQVQ